MPTKKRRIGFIPRFDVLKVINKISEEEKLSNSKVVNILLEEALHTRGLINEIEDPSYNEGLRDFINKIGDLQNKFYENEFKFTEGKEEFMHSKDNTRIYIRFIQFLYFKKMMNIFEEYNL